MERLRRSIIRRRKYFAEEFGVELELTDEQWWEP